MIKEKKDNLNFKLKKQKNIKIVNKKYKIF